jgi:hypothetical protein
MNEDFSCDFAKRKETRKRCDLHWTTGETGLGEEREWGRRRRGGRCGLLGSGPLAGGKCSPSRGKAMQTNAQCTEK